MRTVWIVGEFIPGCGNLTTAEKLSRIFAAAAQEEVDGRVFDRAVLVSKDEVLLKASHCSEDELPALVLAIHAIKSALPIVEAASCPLAAVPMIVLLSGTDMSCDVRHDADKVLALRKVFQAPQTKAAVAISPVISELYQDLIVGGCKPTESVAPCTYVPQAVELAETFDGPSLAEACGFSKEQRPRIALLVAGIRAVKDPGYLVDVFLHHPLQSAEDPAPIHLAIVGPALDPSLLDAAILAKGGVDRRSAIGEKTDSSLVFTDTDKRKPQCIYLGTVPRPLLLSWMQQADVVLNSSLSEGQSNAILEAMAMGRPVVARRIPGNLAILDTSRGFLYESATECFGFVREICFPSNELSSSDLKIRLDLASSYIREMHSLSAEQKEWEKLALKALTSAQ